MADWNRKYHHSPPQTSEEQLNEIKLLGTPDEYKNDDLDNEGRRLWVWDKLGNTTIHEITQEVLWEHFAAQVKPWVQLEIQRALHSTSF